MLKTWIISVIFLSLFVINANAENNSSIENNSDLAKLNQSLDTGEIREIVNASRNSSEQLFGQFHENSDALSALPGLESMIGFIERLLQIMLDTFDKIASYLPYSNG